MKILAKNDDHPNSTFIVEMTEMEIARAAGFSSSYDGQWHKALGLDRRLKSGMTINVSAAYDYHHRVIQNEATAKSAANTLRALADLIGGALPDVVIPPVVEKSEGGDA